MTGTRLTTVFALTGVAVTAAQVATLYAVIQGGELMGALVLATVMGWEIGLFTALLLSRRYGARRDTR